MNIGRSLYQLAYEKSPIFLVDGIASLIPGGVLPLIAITQSGSVATGLLTGNISTKLDDFFATFKPLPGGTLVNNQIGTYPFANQKTAANAIIAQPLTISLAMDITPRLQGGMATRIMIATALKNALDNHNYRGGTYNVLTPTYFYKGCIMTGFKDITSGESKHQQTTWQLDFVQPLISENEAVLYQNALMQKLTNGIPSGVLWSGV